MHKQSYTPLALAALVAMGSYQPTRPALLETLAAGCILIGLGVLVVDKGLDSATDYQPAPRPKQNTTYAQPTHTHTVETRAERIKSKIAACRTAMDQDIDWLCKTESKSYTDASSINALKSTLFEMVKNEIEYHEHVSYASIRAKAQNIAAQHIGSEAYTYALKEIHNKWHSNYIDPEDAATAVGATIAEEVIKKYDAFIKNNKDEKWGLQGYWGEMLKRRVEKDVRHYYESKRPRPSAPPAYDEEPPSYASLKWADQFKQNTRTA